MTDFHSHILPGIDDGSTGIGESLGMLDMLAGQGVTAAAATPHFDPARQTVDGFLSRRAESLGRLSPHLGPGHPEILPGAEVLYCPGIRHLEGLGRLCLSGTRLLMLEMPERRWAGHTVRELEELSWDGGFRLLVAHMERCLPYQPGEVLEGLLDSGVYMQANAGFFLERGTRRSAFRLLRDGAVHLLGSDCHGTAGRPPRIGGAARLIRKRLGAEYLERMDSLGREILENRR